MNVDGRGTLNLQGQFGPIPGRAFLATHLRSDRAQMAGFRIAVGSPRRIYLNGLKVAEEIPASSRIAPGVGGSFPFLSRTARTP